MDNRKNFQNFNFHNTYLRFHNVSGIAIADQQHSFFSLRTCSDQMSHLLFANTDTIEQGWRSIRESRHFQVDYVCKLNLSKQQLPEITTTLDNSFLKNTVVVQQHFMLIFVYLLKECTLHQTWANYGPNPAHRHV